VSESARIASDVADTVVGQQFDGSQATMKPSKAAPRSSSRRVGAPPTAGQPVPNAMPHVVTAADPPGPPPNAVASHCQSGAADDRLSYEGAKVFQQAWAPAEGDEAVGQWAMTLRQPRPVTGGMTQLVALAFPRE
jgi:hypothetical protein